MALNEAWIELKIKEQEKRSIEQNYLIKGLQKQVNELELLHHGQGS